MSAMDPVSKAPLEVAIMILKHLPISDSWRLRSVSKAWNTMLSTETVVTAAIGRWPTSSTQTGLVDRVERFKVEYTGRPLSAKTLNLTDAVKSVFYGSHITTLNGHFMAYLSYGDDRRHSFDYYTLTVVDLSTSSHIKYYPDCKTWQPPRCLGMSCCDARIRLRPPFSEQQFCIEEHCRGIILTDDMAGLVTNRGLLTVDRHSDDVHFSAVDFPQPRPYRFVSHGYHVIVLWHDFHVDASDTIHGPAVSTMPFKAWTFNHKTKAQHTFSIPPASLENDPYHHEFDAFYLRRQDLLMFSTTTVVGMHERKPELKAEDGFRMNIRRYSLSGELLERISFPNLVPHCHDVDHAGLCPRVQEADAEQAYRLIWPPDGPCSDWSDMVVHIKDGVVGLPRVEETEFGILAVWAKSMYFTAEGGLVCLRMVDDTTYSYQGSLWPLPQIDTTHAEASDLFINAKVLVWRLEIEDEGTYVHAFSLDPDCVLDSPVQDANSVSRLPEQSVWTWARANSSDNDLEGSLQDHEDEGKSWDGDDDESEEDYDEENLA